MLAAPYQAQFQAPFRSAQEAARFAFQYAAEQYDRPGMSRMAAPVISTGKGLAGVDGAGQSGMVRSAIHGCGPIAEAIATVREAPRTWDCTCGNACCSGRRPNREWLRALSVLCDRARSGPLATTAAVYSVRRACVVRYFSDRTERAEVTELALALNCSRNTMSAYVGKVAAWLAPLEREAWGAIDERLRAGGAVG
jgi:hypothetical protein